MRKPTPTPSAGRSQVWLTVWIVVALAVALAIAALTAHKPTPTLAYLVPGKQPSPNTLASEIRTHLP